MGAASFQELGVTEFTESWECCLNLIKTVATISVLLPSHSVPAVAQLGVFPSCFSVCVLHWSKEKGVIYLLLWMHSSCCNRAGLYPWPLLMYPSGKPICFSQ